MLFMSLAVLTLLLAVIDLMLMYAKAHDETWWFIRAIRRMNGILTVDGYGTYVNRYTGNPLDSYYVRDVEIRFIVRAQRYVSMLWIVLMGICISAIKIYASHV